MRCRKYCTRLELTVVKRQKNKSCLRSAVTLLEMVIAVAIVTTVFAAILPLFRTIQNSWDSKQGSAEAIQNGRVLSDHLNRNLSVAVKITAVSNSSVTDGYIEFEDNDGNTLRYDIAASNYVEFGPVGDLSDLAGPVSTLQFTCYDACDLNTPITDVNSIRFVKAETTLTNAAALGQDKTFTASFYLRTNGNSSPSQGGTVTYEEFTEAKASPGVSLTIPTPGGVSAGDLLVAAVATDGDTSSSLAPPGGEGWTEINLNDLYSAVTLGVWWKLADASESSSHQFTWSLDQKAYGWIMRFTGHNTSSPINASAGQGQNSSSPDCPSVTTTVANTMIVRIGGFDDADITVDDPGLSGHTPITMDESGPLPGECSGGAGYVQQAAIGASGISEFSLTASEQSWTVTIAIAPEPDSGEEIRP